MHRPVWPHDVITNDKYAYYTDHFSYVLGRVDLKTGEGVEMPFPRPTGAGRDDAEGRSDGRPGNPGGGAHELQFDRQGNVIVGMDNGTVKYDPKTGQFMRWAAGHNMFGRSRRQRLVSAEERRTRQPRHQQRSAEADGVHHSEEQGNLRHRHRFQGPDRSLYLARRQDRHLRSQDGLVRRLPDAHAPVRSAARPDRRSGRPWAAEFYAGPVAMFDPDKQVTGEYLLINGGQALHGALRGTLFRERR